MQSTAIPSAFLPANDATPAVGARSAEIAAEKAPAGSWRGRVAVGLFWIVNGACLLVLAVLAGATLLDVALATSPKVSISAQIKFYTIVPQLLSIWSSASIVLAAMIWVDRATGR